MIIKSPNFIWLNKWHGVHLIRSNLTIILIILAILLYYLYPFSLPPTTWLSRNTKATAGYHPDIHFHLPCQNPDLFTHVFFVPSTTNKIDLKTFYSTEQKFKHQVVSLMTLEHLIILLQCKICRQRNDFKISLYFTYTF